jgi:hypothetical protein
MTVPRARAKCHQGDEWRIRADVETGHYEPVRIKECRFKKRSPGA